MTHLSIIDFIRTEMSMRGSGRTMGLMGRVRWCMLRVEMILKESGRTGCHKWVRLCSMRMGVSIQGISMTITNAMEKVKWFTLMGPHITETSSMI